MNRVVITGMGIYSCIGKNRNEVKQSLYEGRSGIVYDPARKAFGYRSALTGSVEKPNLKGLVDRRARIMMPEQAEYAFMATREAVEQAGLSEAFLEEKEIGLIYGNDSSAEPVVLGVDLIREKKDTTLLGSGSVFQTMNSTVTMNLSTIFHLKGINFTVSAACASGSHAIGLGYHFIKSGLQEMIICGGAQELNLFSMGNFDALSAFSIRENEPTKASRPFDKNRDGLIPSGGAATVILESLESALARGATILAEVVGYGFSSNGAHISNPTVSGPVRALQMALKDAGMDPAEIAYINAHATSTQAGDASEARAIDAVFGQFRPWVSSTKSMTGHECWMAGASEIVYSVLMMQNSFIAPNINLEEPDEDSAKLNIARETVNTEFDCFLSNSFGFGGTNSSLIIRKYQP
ncbi:MAG: beta-ketoacyl-[acyl-carrier-protein] synthase family protein [Bacteroidetes bacterium]|nr:beta-ketoacyl-[acyl-carrier-protein] synthase family protein [Bacteroidota bacterium]HOA38685.1 beta-ketoacyl-[acyl-carrier-protein] synthase family protein [Flavihumibacter sp.]